MTSIQARYLNNLCIANANSWANEYLTKQKILRHTEEESCKADEYIMVNPHSFTGWAVTTKGAKEMLRWSKYYSGE